MSLTMYVGSRKRAARRSTCFSNASAAIVLLAFLAFGFAFSAAHALKAKRGLPRQTVRVVDHLPPSVAAARRFALLMLSEGRDPSDCALASCPPGPGQPGMMLAKYAGQSAAGPTVTSAGTPEPTPQENEADRRDNELAHKAADVALEEGAAYVRGPAAQSLAFSPACTAGMCLPSRSDIPVWSDPQLHVWESSATSQVVSNPVPGVSQPPRYIIELLGPSSTEDATGGQTLVYRITSSGWGAKRSSRVGGQLIVRVTGPSDRHTLAALNR